jgi:hypothetical protein
MTRSGSLAYYMAGVVCGSFFYTLVHFVADFGNRASNGVWGRDILLAFFLGTIFGWFPQIVAAFVLRKLSGPLKWSAAWHWVVGGAGIFLVVFLLIGIAGAQLEPLTAGTRYDGLERILFGQAMLSARSSVWQGLLAGAATSFVLYRVHRAFALPVGTYAARVD